MKEAALDDHHEKDLRLVDKAAQSIIDEVPRLQNVDFSPLLEHPADWAEHTEIPDDYVRLMNAAFVHYNGDVGLCYVSLGENTLQSGAMLTTW